MRGLGNADLREAVWERQYWRSAEGVGVGGGGGNGSGGGGAGGNGSGGGGSGGGGAGGGGGGNGDQRLSFEDAEKLCKRLNINPSKEDLLRRFQVSFLFVSSFAFRFRSFRAVSFPGAVLVFVYAPIHMHA